ncbi:MAG: SDR family oxidoreductase [Pseudomonadota bacterium]
MSELLGYKGKQVVVTGAASGMGLAACNLLVELGAQVWALDIADIDVPAANTLTTDMKDPAAIDQALQQLPVQVDSLFNCAGVPSPPFSARDTVLINFCGLRYLTDALVERIPEGGSILSIASTAGMAWKSKLDTVKEFLALDNSFASAEQWMDANPEGCADGYGFSKQCIIVYTLQNAKALAAKGIRINCVSPSPTNSGFMTTLKGEGQMPDEAIDLFLPSNGRYASGADMAEPMVLLNSKLAGFVSGVNLPIDYGYCAEVFLGQRDNLLGIS